MRGCFQSNRLAYTSTVTQAQNCTEQVYEYAVVFSFTLFSCFILGKSLRDCLTDITLGVACIKAIYLRYFRSVLPVTNSWKAIYNTHRMSVYTSHVVEKLSLTMPTIKCYCLTVSKQCR
ncbi:hypothetical protein AHF37_07615 [Paragonimus kellicotti]|nr:hypothetical protein AHF37_07615 [Paragonimus kellicotti]